jgi:hypothetical protein
MKQMDRGPSSLGPLSRPLLVAELSEDLFPLYPTPLMSGADLLCLRDLFPSDTRFLKAIIT